MAVLASCSKALLTHDLQNTEPCSIMTPHKGAINSAVWSHNNQVIASAGSDGKIVLNHAWKGTNLLSLDDENSRAAQVNSAWFTSNSQLLASGGNDCLLKIWDLKKRSLISSHKYHFGSITSVHWNLDDSLIASSSLTGDIVLHNVKFETQTANFNQKGSQGIKMIKFSPYMANCIASAGMDGSVFVWDINTRQPSATFLSNHSSRVNAISFSSHNPVLMCSAGLDQNVNFYDIRDRKVVKTLSTDAPLTALAFHNDGHTIAVGTLYGGLYIYDLKASGSPKLQLAGHDSQINFVDFLRPEQKDSSKASTAMVEEDKQISRPSTSWTSPLETLQSSKKATPTMDNIKISTFPSDPVGSAAAKNSLLASGGSMKIEEQKSVLDPKGELKSPFLDMNHLRKQASDVVKPRENLLDKSPTPVRPTTSLLVSPNPLHQEPIVKSAQQLDITKKVFESTRTSAAKDKEPDSAHSMHSMQIEPPKGINLLNTNILEKIDDRTNSYVNKVESVNINQPQKEFIQECFREQNHFFKECLFDLQSSVSENIGNLHLEVIRQFEIQKNELDAKLDRYFTEFNSLFLRHEEMRNENERLKKTSY